ncbi:DHHA1 domain-containing protein, partial [Frankia sp. CcWB3]
VVVTDDAARGRGLRAGDLVRQSWASLGGKGGGKPDVAQGGGGGPQLVPAVFARLRGLVAEHASR